MILKLSLDLPEDVAYIRMTRLLSRCVLDEIKVIDHTVDDIENIIGELCSNVIRHAQSTAMHFLVTLEFYEPKLVITVTDTGKGFVLGDVEPVGTSRSDGNGGKRIGGFGLSILEGLADRVDFTETDPHGTTVRVEKHLRYETTADAKEAAKRDAESGAVVTASKD
jgi:anti-sigma regulatory factor (Ser/Thr protein kinase)